MGRPSPPERIIRRRTSLVGLNLPELWRYRDVFVILTWRDILLRYKQTALGVGWALLQPVLTAVVFTILFGQLARFPGKGAPYVLVTFAALLPWQLFANALSESSNSIVASSSMVSKVYFPRLLIPVSAVCSGLADFFISFLVLLALMAWYRAPFYPQIFLLPFFTALACLAALAFGIWLSALNVRYRDVKYVVPFFTRIGLYISPVGFASTIILQKFGPGAYFFYSLNPMAGVIEAFRWCILGEAFRPDWAAMGASLAVTCLILFAGGCYFRRTETTFADVI